MAGIIDFFIENIDFLLEINENLHLKATVHDIHKISYLSGELVAVEHFIHKCESMMDSKKFLLEHPNLSDREIMYTH